MSTSVLEFQGRHFENVLKWHMVDLKKRERPCGNFSFTSTLSCWAHLSHRWKEVWSCTSCPSTGRWPPWRHSARLNSGCPARSHSTARRSDSFLRRRRSPETISSRRSRHADRSRSCLDSRPWPCPWWICSPARQLWWPGHRKRSCSSCGRQPRPNSNQLRRWTLWRVQHLSMIIRQHFARNRHTFMVLNHLKWCDKY